MIRDDYDPMADAPYDDPAVKYAIRAGRKNPDKELEDIRKAIQCLQFEAERIERLTDDA